MLSRFSRINVLKYCICKHSEPIILQQLSFGWILKNNLRQKSLCATNFVPPDPKPCFDIRNVTIVRGTPCHSKLIRSFLYSHFWPREPSVTGVWMSQDSDYLKILTEKYATSGIRLLAFERIKRTGEQKLVGVVVCNRVFPWVADELEEWAHYTKNQAEKHRMYLCAHIIKAPNLFKKFGVDYVYEVEVLATASEVSGQGVGFMLLKYAIQDAMTCFNPLVQVIASSAYTAKLCEKCNMKRAWSMNYSEFVDNNGQRVYFPRRPHHTISIYVMPYTPDPFSPCPK